MNIARRKIRDHAGAEVGSPASFSGNKMFNIVQNAFALCSGRD
jgi:hypothetical protein